MAIDKYVIEMLGIGQGSCNVVLGYDGADLRYLAIFDGGTEVKDSNKRIPKEAAKAKLIAYLKARGTVKGGSFEMYADFVSISHSDEDHYSLLHEIAKESAAYISVLDASRKLVYVPAPARAPYRRPPSESENAVETFEDIHRQCICTYTFDSETYFQSYSEGDLQYSVSLVRTFNYSRGHAFLDLNERLDVVFEMFCNTITLHLQKPFGGYYTFNCNQRRSCIVDGVIWEWDCFCFNIESGRIDIDVVLYRTVDTSGTPINLMLRYRSTSPFTAATVSIFTLLANFNLSGGHDAFTYSLNNLYLSVNIPIDTASSLFQSSLLLPMDSKYIVGRATPAASPAAYDAPIPNSLRFGSIMTSTSLGSLPAGVKMLIGKSDLPILKPPPIATAAAPFVNVPNNTPPGLYIDSINDHESTCIYYHNEFNDPRHGNAPITVPFDKHHRNINSIITAVKVNGRPAYIFTGDATVQNLWYNVLNNAGRINSSGGILVLPHHGSERTSAGNYNKAAVGSTPVFCDFLTTVSADIIFVSAGFKNKFSHPGYNIINACDQYLASKPSPTTVNSNIYYHDTKKYIYCIYNKPIYTTITMIGDAASSGYKEYSSDWSLTYPPATVGNPTPVPATTELPGSSTSYFTYTAPPMPIAKSAVAPPDARTHIRHQPADFVIEKWS